MTLSFYQFEKLSLELLYSILALRQRVFVVEQKSIYTDLDGLDQSALHVCIQQHKDGEVIGYARLRLDQKSKIAKLERVVVDLNYRGKGIADQLMQACVNKSVAQQMAEIKLSAQIEVIPYYNKWGFTAIGNVYDDGGIDHRDMIKRLGSNDTPA